MTTSRIGILLKDYFTQVQEIHTTAKLIDIASDSLINPGPLPSRMRCSCALVQMSNSLAQVPGTFLRS